MILNNGVRPPWWSSGLRLHAPNAGGWRLTPSQGTRSHMQQLRVLKPQLKKDPVCCHEDPAEKKKRGDDTHITFLEHLCCSDAAWANTSTHTALTFYTLLPHASTLCAFSKDSNCAKVLKVESGMFQFHFPILSSRGNQR